MNDLELLAKLRSEKYKCLTNRIVDEISGEYGMEKEFILSHKHCSCCKEFKHKDEYTKVKKGYQKLYALCKECSRKKQEELRKKNPLMQRLANIKHREKLRNSGVVKRLESKTDFIFKLGHKFEAKCFNCGSEKNLTIDHHRPFVRGNVIEEGNAVLLCQHCNSSKGALPPEEFYSEEQIKILKNKYKVGV